MNTTLFENCFHGGAFFQTVGERFEALERDRTIIKADVLDAWFPRAPEVLESLSEHLPWLLRTSPPTTARDSLRPSRKCAECRGRIFSSVPAPQISFFARFANG